MKIVDVQLQQICVEKFDPRTEIVDFCVQYNDGKGREIKQQSKIGKPLEMASSLMKQIRADVRKRTKPSFDDSPLEGIVTVRFDCRDLDELYDRMIKFFKSISNNIQNAKTARLSYHEISLKITGIKILF